ncbi:MAG: hypothetical protein ACPGJS_17525 [Flammeovirgaceae bacterium]
MNRAALQLRQVLRELKDLEKFQAATQKYIKDTFGLYYHIRQEPIPQHLNFLSVIFRYKDADGSKLCVLDNDFKYTDFEIELFHKNLAIIATQTELLDKTKEHIAELKKKGLALCELITEKDLHEAKDYEEQQQFDLHYQRRQLMLKKASMEDVIIKKYELIYHIHMSNQLPALNDKKILYTKKVKNQNIYIFEGDYLPKSAGFIEFTKSLIANEEHILDTISQKLILVESLINQGHQFIK